MTLRIAVQAPTLTTDERSIFRGDAKVVFDVYRRLRRRHALPSSRLEVILTGDFVAELSRGMSSAGEHEEREGSQFSPEPAGGLGVVAAKNLDQTGDERHVVIVLDASHWRGASEGPTRLAAINLLAHELAHPLFGRAEHVSDVLGGVEFPSHTGGEIARSMTRMVSGEYRADRLAEMVVCACVMTSETGALSPANSWAVQGDAYGASAHQDIEAAYPAWPDLVQAYRGASQ